MSFNVSTTEIKQVIIQALALEDLTPEDIADDMPLFDGGLALDSIDTLELGIALRKRYNVSFGEDGTFRQRLRTPLALATFIKATTLPRTSETP